MRIRIIAWALAAWLAWAAGASRAQAAPEVTPDQVAALLASMHPEYRTYISSVRYGASRLRPASLYAGLVRQGGRDPREPGDGPLSGRGIANDLIVYADTFEPWRSPAWRMLVTDHEYFHARHLAHGAAVPVVGFGEAQANADYYEALAWGHVLGRAAAGDYGQLSDRERAEVAQHYREHRDGFRRFVMDRQASAWDHYGRFLPEDPERAARARAGAPPTPAPQAALPPGVGGAGR
ncbi:MAG: hypothetical protein ACREAA_21265 [Candidatus Polarisedimenticolia bacterium]